MISDRCEDIVHHHLGSMLIDLRRIGYKLENISVNVDDMLEDFNFRVNISFIGKKDG